MQAGTGAVVHTDGWKGYNDLPKHGYVRQKTVLASSDDPAHVAMPGVHRVASLLKRWILGTHQGSVDPSHLQSPKHPALAVPRVAPALLFPQI